MLDEQQDSIQKIQNQFKSDSVGYTKFINKWVEFSQSFLEVPTGGDSRTQNQISVDCMYIEIIQTFEIELIIADTKWISEPYRIFSFGVKPKARKMWLYENGF